MSGTDDDYKKKSLADLMRLGANAPANPSGGFGAVFGLPSPGGLAGLLKRPEVNGLYFNTKTLTLDGYTFIGCRFDNCTLHVTTPNFDLIRCVIDESTTIIYGVAVLRVIQLFNSRYPWAYEHLKGFVPTRNADGTITISDRVG
ncbi:MAG: hypothetical protein ACTS6J_07890 [Burkholderiales bacterium]